MVLRFSTNTRIKDNDWLRFRTLTTISLRIHQILNKILRDLEELLLVTLVHLTSYYGDRYPRTRGSPEGEEQGGLFSSPYGWRKVLGPKDWANSLKDFMTSKGKGSGSKG